MKVNKIKNIGVLIDITPKSGGKHHLATSMVKYISRIKEFNFHYITTFQETKKILEKELNIEFKIYEKTSVYNRILNKLYENLNFFLSFIRLKNLLSKIKLMQ